MAAETSTRRARREPNRLHRSTARLERLLTCVLGLLAVVAAGVAIAAGDSAYTAVADRARTESADRTQVSAVPLTDAVPITKRAGSAAREVPVSWTDRHGTDRTATIRVAGLRRAGGGISIWTDDDGRVVPAPTSLVDATVAGLVSGILVAVVAGGAVYLTGSRVVRLDRQALPPGVGAGVGADRSEVDRGAAALSGRVNVHGRPTA